MRMPWPAAVAGVAVAVLGSAGLVRGAMPPSTPSGPAGVASPPIVVSGAYVREPAPPTDAAAAYFTVFNTTGRPDRLLSVQSGAGAVSILHTTTANGDMVATPDGVVIPAHGRLVLTTGGGHVMIENLFGKLLPGQNVSIQLSFATAGPVEVTAPVIALGAPAPTGAAARTTAPTPSTGGTK